MANNIFQNLITPLKPKVLEGERIYVYVPTATTGEKGIASFNERDFGVNAGQVSLIWSMSMEIEQLTNPLNTVSRIKLLEDEFENTNNLISVVNPVTGTAYSTNSGELKLNRKNRNAFVRPDLFMVDESEFEAKVDTVTNYVKYTLKAGDVFNKPSLVQLSTTDFKKNANDIIEIIWPFAHEDMFGLIKVKADRKASGLYFDENNELQLDFAAQLGDDNYNFITKGAAVKDADDLNNIAIGEGAWAWNFYKDKTGGAIAIGTNSKSVSSSIAIGNGADTTVGSGGGGVAIGEGARADNASVAIGWTVRSKGVAIGYRAASDAGKAIQLGEGSNNEPETFKVFNYRIMDQNGKVYTNNGTKGIPVMVEVASMKYVQEIFTALQNGHFKIVDELPTENISATTIYLLRSKGEGADDEYLEYIYIDGVWEKLGATRINWDDIYNKEQVDDLLLNNRKQLILGAEGVLEADKYNFTVENAEDYMVYRTNGTKFLVDLNLPITGPIDYTKELTITFGDTSYYVYNILKGQERVVLEDLRQIDKYNNAVGYRFITEMMFFDNADLAGFAIIPTVSVSDVLSLNSDQMDDYMADGGLAQGQLAICCKVINNGYNEGSIYRFDIQYPNTYSWVEISGGGSGGSAPTVIRLPKEA